MLVVSTFSLLSQRHSDHGISITNSSILYLFTITAMVNEKFEIFGNRILEKFLPCDVMSSDCC